DSGGERCGFFFQAEDGIRDFHVTGVQTCALPILEAGDVSLPTGILQEWPVGTPMTIQSLATLMISISDNTATDVLLRVAGRDTEIGRASCRERRQSAAAGEAVQQTHGESHDHLAE